MIGDMNPSFITSSDLLLVKGTFIPKVPRRVVGSQTPDFPEIYTIYVDDVKLV